MGRVWGPSALPAMSVLLHTSSRMAFSGVIHGPPAMAHPGQVCTVSLNPSSFALLPIKDTISSHSGVSALICWLVAGHCPPK